MFFVASKALWFFAAPSALLILGALVGAAFSARRSGQLLALGCLAVLLVIGAAPARRASDCAAGEPLSRAARQPAAALRRRRARRRDRRRHHPRARPDDLRRRRGTPDRSGDPRPSLPLGADRLHRRQQFAARSSVERGGRRAPPARRDGRRFRSASRSKRARATPTRTRASPPRSSTPSLARLGWSSLPPITCRGRWDCSARRVSPRSPIRSTIAPRAGAAIGA